MLDALINAACTDLHSCPLTGQLCFVHQQRDDGIAATDLLRDSAFDSKSSSAERQPEQCATELCLQIASKGAEWLELVGELLQK